MAAFDIFFNGNFEVRRQRVLDEIRRVQGVVEEGRENTENLQTTFNAANSSYERASDKANILLTYSARVADKYTIPVPEASSEIRAAVMRQDREGSNNGEYITFSLFQRCVEKIEKEAMKVNYAIINDRVTADPLANERNITATLNTDTDDDDLSLILSLGSQFLVLYLIHAVTGMWRGSETVLGNPKFAGPNPVEPGSAIAESIRQVAVGTATSFLITGINETLAFLLADSGNDTAIDRASIIQGGISQASQVDLPPLVELAVKALSVNDHKIIVKHAVKYASSTQERGYEFWLAYITARRARYFSKRTRSLAPALSRKAFANKNLGFNVDGPLVDPDDVILEDPNLTNNPNTTIAEGISAEVVAILNSTVANPVNSYICAIDQEAGTLESGLNEIAQVLDTRLGRDAICCLVRFLGSIDPDILRRIRALIQIFLNSQLNLLAVDFDLFLDRLLSWVKSTIIRLIVSLINQLLDIILELVLELIIEISEDLEFLIECPLILDLINSILEGVSWIFNDLQQLIDKLVTEVVIDGLLALNINAPDERATRAANITGLHLIYRKRRLNTILLIIDRILSVIEQETYFCAKDDVPEFEEQNRNFITFDDFTDNIVDDLEDYLNIPQEVKEAYFADAKAIDLPDGSSIPDYLDGIIRPASPDDIQLVSDCAPGFGSDKLAEILGRFRRK